MLHEKIFKPLTSKSTMYTGVSYYYLKYICGVSDYVTKEDENIVLYNNPNNQCTIESTPVAKAIETDFWKHSWICSPLATFMRGGWIPDPECSLIEIVGEDFYQFSVPPAVLKGFRSDYKFNIIISHTVPPTDPDWWKNRWWIMPLNNKAHSFIRCDAESPTAWYNSYTNSIYLPGMIKHAHREIDKTSGGLSALYIKSKPYKIHILISNKLLEHLRIRKIATPSLEFLCARRILQTYSTRPPHIHPITWEMANNHKPRICLTNLELSYEDYDYYIRNRSLMGSDIFARQFVLIYNSIIIQ